GSAPSTLPSQSLSLPSHTSRPSKLQRYSQPSAGSPLASLNPVRQGPRAQLPPVHRAMALAYWQRLLQPPQKRGSLALSKPSSAIPSQSLSASSHTSVLGVTTPSQASLPPWQAQ